MSLPETHKVIRIDETAPGNDYSVLKYTDNPTPKIEGPYDVIVKNRYAGLNLLEAFFRRGIIPVPLPWVLGREAAGTVVAVGDKVTEYKVGSKVAHLQVGTYAQYTKFTEQDVYVTKLADDASDEKLKEAAAALLQGLTVISLATEAHEIKKGEVLLIWAAAGGCGKFLIQLAKLKGAKTIGVVSSDEKAKQATAVGADYVINSSTEDVAAKLKEYAPNGVNASFDSLGKDSFDITLNALARKGTFVSFGSATGHIPPVDLLVFGSKNIKFVRTQLWWYVATKEEWKKYSDILFNLIDSGDLKLDISATYPLSEYAIAEEAMEARKTTGKVVLDIPQ